MGLRGVTGKGPRFHDLRHTFAVRRLAAWYAAGLDVQALLPSLATYLGHGHCTETAWYMTATPELLSLAAARAERARPGGGAVTAARPALGTLLESFFQQRLRAQCHASPATIGAYRDALRLFVLFAAEQAGKRACELELSDLDGPRVLAFLDHLERARDNSIRTRNARRCGPFSSSSRLATRARSRWRSGSSRSPRSAACARCWAT
ncbi:MAG: hypothetical protein MUF34_11615 [Polyangiaceae bacterium]|nr:hypothetical protein [Polyangiaceae bacterium]